MKKHFFNILSILFTTAIQSQDISNKWAINIGSGLVIYPGKYDPYLGFRYTEQFPRFSISRYMFKNITFSGALSISPNQRKKYTTLDGEIKYDYSTSENIISISGSVTRSL